MGIDIRERWDPEPEEFSIENEGVRMGGISRLQAELMERLHDSPIPIYGQAFTRAGWRQVAARLRRKERSCQIPALQERYRAARIMAQKMPPGASPWDAMVNLYEIHKATKVPIVDGLCRRLMREECYIQLQEFAGRNVG